MGRCAARIDTARARSEGLAVRPDSSASPRTARWHRLPARRYARRTRVGLVRQMKILWICGSKIVGGAERVTIQVLALLRERLHPVGALLPATSPVNEAVEGLASAVHTARLGGSRDLLSIAAITRAVRAFGPQVVVVTTPQRMATVVRGAPTPPGSADGVGGRTSCLQTAGIDASLITIQNWKFQ